MVTIGRPPAKPPDVNDSAVVGECDIDSQAPTEIVEYDDELPLEIREEKTSSNVEDDAFSRAPTVRIEYVSDDNDTDIKSDSDHRIGSVHHNNDLIRIRGHVASIAPLSWLIVDQQVILLTIVMSIIIAWPNGN